MPRKPESPETPDPAVPRAYAQACRYCGATISFDATDDDIVRCECGRPSLRGSHAGGE